MRKDRMEDPVVKNRRRENERAVPKTPNPDMFNILTKL
jgi:hypothetical protein